MEELPKGSKVDGRWVDATDLRIGDRMLLRDGRGATVEVVTHINSQTTVCNFSVAELEKYAVGIRQILVHNTNARLEAAANAPNSGLPIQYGKDANQTSHALRHIDGVVDVAVHSTPKTMKNCQVTPKPVFGILRSFRV